MLEDFIYALQGFKRNRTRTFLSLLGVIIGVAAVIVITSMGNSSTKQVQDTFGTSGLDVVSISQGFMRRGGQNSVTVTFDEKFREDMFDNVPNIKKIWYKNSLSTTLTYRDASATASCSAVEYGYLEMYNMDIEEGRYFSVTDNEEGLQRIILTHDLAENLFEDAKEAVGKNIMLVADKVTFGFQVIGVLKDQTVGMETGTAFIPRGFYAKKIAPNPAAATVFVQVTSAEKSTEMVSTLTTYCTMTTGTSLRVNSMQTMLEQMSSITNTMSVLLAAVAAISLLVGGIGIMNIMIVTVTERRQEIGIRKALGANPKDIIQQFLIESASITIIGGFIGILSGTLISVVVEVVRHMSITVSIPACIISFVFSVFVGIFFGLNPAIRASKLDPVEALAS
ncbi:MAG: ABC transporter permease [Treponema sp.]|uniref:ABC transporter permease n=1 Tax=Treponema sp. TaxID=166 RepID=UPI00298E7C47|nr:ABC transporter permease [Treponema sp.]MCQ2601135.1 ABC transporter permease [Treponema sp.]